MIGQVMVHVELPLYRASPTFLTNPSFLPITYMRHLVLSVTAPRSYFQLRVSLESPLVACCWLRSVLEQRFTVLLLWSQVLCMDCLLV